jgi:hypothetical protein
MALTQPVPQPLIPGERVELWLELPQGDGTPDAAVDADADSTSGDQDGDDWDVRPARVAAITPEAIVLQAGGWQLAGEAGFRAIVRRFDRDGLAEWEGKVDSPESSGERDPSKPAGFGAPDTTIVIRLPSADAEGHLYQRRRSPRLPVGLTPIRLMPLGTSPLGVPDLSTPAHDPLSPVPVSIVPEHIPGAAAAPSANTTSPELDESELPVARLTDVSATGAGVVVDYPLSAGTTVSLEFELPGETAPFAVRGRVIEPAMHIHGEVQPQADGLPGFRRGVEFIGTAANREVRRLAATLTRLLPYPRTE